MSQTLADLRVKLATFGGLEENVTISDVHYFIRLASHFIREIKLYAPHNSPVPPFRLPTHIHSLFTHCLNMDDLTVIQLWGAFKNDVWSNEEPPSDQLFKAELASIDKHGMRPSHKSDKLASVMFYPPVTTCVTCDSPLHRNTLSRHEATFYSLRDGARRALTSSLACKDCKIRHYHNYYTQEQVRYYYHRHDVPSAIQIEEHAYVDTHLCEYFTNASLFAWVSADKSADIYNHCFSQAGPNDDVSDKILISSEQVSRAFTLNALLRDRAEHASSLILPNFGNNDERLKQATEHRNKRMITIGQSEKMHGCQICEKLIPGTGYMGKRALRAATIDSIKIGRPCCKEHNCTEPLVNLRAHYCARHERKQAECVVTDCMATSPAGFRTCDAPDHRAMEPRRNDKRKARSQSQSRLQKQKVSQPLNPPESGGSAPVGEEVEAPEDHKSDDGNVEPKAHRDRRRTDNEQLIVACCGTILARGTIFGADPITGVKDFVKSVYPYPLDMPDVLFYDNNCKLQSHLLAQQDNFFESVILPVDLFHLKSRHKTDDFCQKNCNPALWPELSDQDGKWHFNTSIAKQANVWLGGYQAIVRDMLPHRYDFFLDEMIKRRNELVVEKLWTSGKVPYHVPYYT